MAVSPLRTVSENVVADGVDNAAGCTDCCVAGGALIDAVGMPVDIAASCTGIGRGLSTVRVSEASVGDSRLIMDTSAPGWGGMRAMAGGLDDARFAMAY